MKKSCLVALALTVNAICYSQTSSGPLDTIYANNDKIVCNVKEVTEDAVKYVYPGEETVNSIYKNAVQKIVFRSGRVSKFTEASSFKTVTGADDYDNVSFSHVESEVKGLFKIDEVSSKSEGATAFSNTQKIKERAIYTLKVQAAMRGANVVFLTQEATAKGNYGYYGSSPTSTNMAGIAYSNTIPSYNDFIAKINQRTNFRINQEIELHTGNTDYSEKKSDEKFHINKIINDNGFIMIKGTIGKEPEDTFRVISFNDTYFTIFISNTDATYNMKVNFDENAYTR